MEKNDYIVVKNEAKQDKFILVKAIDIGTKKVAGLLESTRKDDKVESVTVKLDDIVANLGQSPPKGKVYGLDLTNRYRKTIYHDYWGKVMIWTAMDKETMTLVRKSLDRTAVRIDKLGLGPYVQLIDTHLQAKQGKWAGKYHHSSDQEKQRCFVRYAPEFAEGSSEAMDYVVYHELGHCVRYNGVTGKKIRLKWLYEYNKSITPIEVDFTTLKRLFKHIQEYEDQDDSLAAVLRDYTADDEDERKSEVAALLRWFKNVHHLGPKDLSLMWEAQDLDALKDLWPTKAIDTSKLAPVVTEYATVNVEELFAESFAMYCQRKKLPQRIESLLDRSLQYAKANAPK